jgi:hypothetical protein
MHPEQFHELAKLEHELALTDADRRRRVGYRRAGRRTPDTERPGARKAAGGPSTERRPAADRARRRDRRRR